MIKFKGGRFERDVILWAVRWYVAYAPISYGQLEEMMAEHGVKVEALPRFRGVFDGYIDHVGSGANLRGAKAGLRP